MALRRVTDAATGSGSRVLLDTCVVSYSFKRNHHGERFRPYVEESICVVSFMTVAELMRWSLSRKWGRARRQDLKVWLNQCVIFEEVNSDLCDAWARITHQGEVSGRKIHCGDAWIAASAIILDIPLLTNNKADFEGVGGLTLLPPA